MKTAMQELIEYLESNMEHGLAHHIKVKFLPKEKQQIINAVIWFDDTDRKPHQIEKSVIEYFNQKYPQANNKS